MVFQFVTAALLGLSSRKIRGNLNGTAGYFQITNCSRGQRICGTMLRTILQLAERTKLARETLCRSLKKLQTIDRGHLKLNGTSASGDVTV